MKKYGLFIIPLYLQNILIPVLHTLGKSSIL